MKLDLVEPFIKATQEIIIQMGNIHTTRGELYEKKQVKLKNDVAIVVGMTGDVKGQIIMNFSEEIGRRVVSNMMGGMPVVTLDDMAISALSELGNMIIGNAATVLYQQGVQTDITPPSVLIGENMSYAVASQTITCMPFDTDEGQLEINICLKEIE